MIGASSRDIKFREDIQVESSFILKYLTAKTPFEDWLADPLGKKAVAEVLSEEQIENADFKERPIYRLHFFAPEQISLEEIEEILAVYQKL